MTDNEKFKKLHKICEFIAVGDVLDSRKTAPKAQWRYSEFKHIEFNEYIIGGLFEMLQKDGKVQILGDGVVQVNQDKVKSDYYMGSYLNSIRMTSDDKKVKILNAMLFTQQPFSMLYKRLINESDDEDEIIFPLMNEMIEDKLIRIADGTNQDGEWVVMTTLGNKLKNNGGLIEYLNPKESKGQTFNLKIGDDIQQTLEIKDSTIHGEVNQSSASSKNRKNITPIKSPMSIIKKILIGIGIGVAVGLILFYGFGIGR